MSSPEAQHLFGSIYGRRVNAALRALKLTTLVLTAWLQRPEAGKALVFPSRRVHEGKPVTSGVKYLLVLFLV